MESMKDLGIEFLNSQSSYHRIKTLEVTGGFLDGLKVTFEDSLNCIIGGRGTGKTTIIEFIRFVLDKMPDEVFYPEKYQHLQKLIENNLGNGAIHLTIETRDGQQLNFERAVNSDTIVTDAEGNRLDLSGNSGMLFNVEIYSQDEIEEIAADSLFQLGLIDKFHPQEISDIESKIRVTNSELQQNAASISKTKDLIGIHNEKIATLPEITQKLKAFQLGANDDTQALRKEISNHAIREREKACIEGLSSLYQGRQDELGLITSSLSGETDELFENDILTGPNKELFAQYQKECKAAVADTIKRLSDASMALGKITTQIPTWKTTLTAAHTTQDKTYREALNKHEKEKTRAMERESLLKKYNELLLVKKQLEKAKIEITTLTASRQKLLKQLSDLRDLRYAHRHKVVESLNKQLAPRVKITLEQFGNVDNYEKILKEALRNSGLQYNRLIPKIIKIDPETLARLVSMKDIDVLSEKLAIDKNQAEKFIDSLCDKEIIYRLETVELYDKPSIELKDGNDYKDSTALSTGQRCSTILPILLLKSESPLLIDQPENNLDNAFIYDPVVKTLRTLKGIRQCIFITHNPNIPVIGDAASVFLLSSDGARGKVEKQGNVNALKKEIAALLEGGEDAFNERRRIYGY